MVQTILTTLGALLIAGALIDAFLTMLGMRGGGPITNAWTRLVWTTLLRVHRRRAIHSVLTLAGPALTVGAILVWYVLLLSGWFLIFAASISAVVQNDSGQTATLLERLYFVGATISTVGYGDLVPSHLPWTVIANVSAFTATFLVTTSLSYLMPVISAALERKQLAQDIWAIGDSPEAIIRQSWTGQDPMLLNGYWSDTLRGVNRHAHKHLVYPVLHYFHSRRHEQAPAPAILNLADAVFLISQSTGAERPPEGLLQLWRSAMTNYAEMKRAQPAGNGDAAVAEDVDHLSRQALIDLGLEPVSQSAFAEALSEYEPLRSRILGMRRDDGW